MKQVKEYNQVTRESTVVTYLSIVETNREGISTTKDMRLRHALQAMRVQPERFKLAPTEKLPKGITVGMVPPGTTMDDVEHFEKVRGTVGKVAKTNFDNVLDAIESGLEIQDAVLTDEKKLRSGSMMSEEAPKNFKPEGVDLTPADSMKAPDPDVLTDEEKALDNRIKEEPKLEELKEKELKFETGADAISDYTKQDLKDHQRDKLQAILVTLPGFQHLAKKMQKITIKANKSGLINSIVQLSKKKK